MKLLAGLNTKSSKIKIKVVYCFHFDIVTTKAHDIFKLKVTMAMTWQRNLASANTTTVSNENCFVSSSHITNAFLSFQDMRMKGENCDIFICIHGQRFPAHRVVLARTCKFFREKLVATQVDEEEKPPHFKELEIPGQFEKQIVHSVLDFLYTGKLVLNFLQMNDMLRLLCYLQVKYFLITSGPCFALIRIG